MPRTLFRPLAPAVLLAAALVAAPVAASAQSLVQPRSWTVSPFLKTSVGVGDPASDNSLGLGVALGYDWTENLGFEAEISRLFDVAGDTPDIDWSITNFSANVVYHFDVLRVTPYATAGLGLERSSFNLRETDPAALSLVVDPSSTEVAFNFGGGVKYALDARWIARADVRRFQANDIAPDYWRVYGGVTYVIGQ